MNRQWMLVLMLALVAALPLGVEARAASDAKDHNEEWSGQLSGDLKDAPAEEAREHGMNDNVAAVAIITILMSGAVAITYIKRRWPAPEEKVV